MQKVQFDQARLSTQTAEQVEVTYYVMDLDQFSPSYMNDLDAKKPPTGNVSITMEKNSNVPRGEAMMMILC